MMVFKATKDEGVEMKRIAVVDDEERIVELIRMYLVKEGYQVAGFNDGLALLNGFKGLEPDLIVLDIGLPGMDGLEICREIRKLSEVPIIFVTARDEEIDRILGLEIGGDDYLSKPFSPRELTARIKNIFKRMDRTGTDSSAIVIANLTINRNRRTATAGVAQIKLTAKEYQLLETMCLSPEIPLTREQLLDTVWGNDYIGDFRAVDDLVKRVRKKLKEAGATPSLETVWGYGYKITCEI